jgi:glycosyltransferase involved in cell wall biosynthesis
MDNKPSIVSVVGVYYPGYKAGGILRTLMNMVDHLSSYYNFYIITTDRDLDDKFAYKNINPDVWCDVGSARVIYLSPSKKTTHNITKILNEISYDLIFLNSFFEPLCVKTLLAYQLKMIPQSNLLIAPRGEFAIPSFSQKKIKKIVFIFLAIKMKLLENVIWLASSTIEENEINLAIRQENKVKVLIDLPSKFQIGSFKKDSNILSPIKLIFLSRISEEKNLDFAISILSKVNVELYFDIYGPISNEDYWNKCCKLIEKLPSNITVNYQGIVKPDDIRGIISNYDLFFLPTKGENYGHVIAESLSIGTPVLISDKTPWLNLNDYSLGWDFSLTDENKFVDLIIEFSKKDFKEKNKLRDIVCNEFLKYINLEDQIKTNVLILNQIINLPNS